MALNPIVAAWLAAQQQATQDFNSQQALIQRDKQLQQQQKEHVEEMKFRQDQLASQHEIQQGQLKLQQTIERQRELEAARNRLRVNPQTEVDPTKAGQYIGDQIPSDLPIRVKPMQTATLADGTQVQIPANELGETSEVRTRRLIEEARIKEEAAVREFKGKFDIEAPFKEKLAGMNINAAWLRNQANLQAKADDREATAKLRRELTASQNASRERAAGIRVAARQAEKNDEAKKVADATTKYRVRSNEQILDTIEQLLPAVSGWSTGWGNALKLLPATKAKHLDSLLTTLKSNITNVTLSEMRAASKTGGALGSVSDFENKNLANTLGALDASQKGEEFEEQLLKVYDSINNWNKELGQDRRPDPVSKFPKKQKSTGGLPPGWMELK